MKTLSGRNASQKEFELKSFIDFLKENGVRRYCEIGARHGDTFYEVMTNLPYHSYGLAVDLPGGLWGTNKSRAALERAVDEVIGHNRNAEALFGDSTQEKTVELIKRRAPFDAILIDGDHSLSGVTKDWENYRGLGKIIAFHDIVGTGEFEKVTRRPVEVPILWQKIKGEYQTVEFIDEGSKMGIGCVLM